MQQGSAPLKRVVLRFEAERAALRDAAFEVFNCLPISALVDELRPQPSRSTAIVDPCACQSLDAFASGK